MEEKGKTKEKDVVEEDMQLVGVTEDTVGRW